MEHDKMALSMNERQKIAFDNPCVIAEQTVDQRFKRIESRWTVSGLRIPVSSILTFNFGME